LSTGSSSRRAWMSSPHALVISWAKEVQATERSRARK
jgi:hypothetical protein